MSLDLKNRPREDATAPLDDIGSSPEDRPEPQPSSDKLWMQITKVPSARKHHPKVIFDIYFKALTGGKYRQVTKTRDGTF